MLVVKTVNDLENALHIHRNLNHSVGFVPTMGALHQGHLSLINQAKLESDVVVCSIFVNPTQFNNASDYQFYPRTVEQDLYLLSALDPIIVFLPETQEIYPSNYLKKVYDLGILEEIWEGAYRPGHFQGVCQVVHQLLNFVKPTTLYLGQKDIQQCKVIQKLILQENISVKLSIAPTIREASGLALSSRNKRLSEQEKQSATAIYMAMQQVIEALKRDATVVKTATEKAKSYLLQNGFSKLDYFAVVDGDTLQEQNIASKNSLIIVAAFIGNVRLIDNILVFEEA